MAEMGAEQETVLLVNTTYLQRHVRRRDSLTTWHFPQKKHKDTVVKNINTACVLT